MRPEDMALEFDDTDEVFEPPRSPFPLVAWWHGLDARDQALYQGLAPLALGFAADPWHRTWALGLIVPGAVITIVAVILLLQPVIRRTP